MTNCPNCDSPMEYDRDSGKYYCPICDKHLDPVEAEEKETIYQDTTENPTPDTTTSWDEEAAEE